jgi:glucan phosphoethanolaminetransferase (alkaline phosphatase superfamily)
MFDLLKEIYFTGFVLSFRLGGGSWTRPINAVRGVCGVTLVELAIVIGMASWMDMLFGTKCLEASKLTISIACFALYFANYYILVTCRHGLKYEDEYNKVPRTKKLIISSCCIAITVIAIVFFVDSGIAHRRFLSKNGISFKSSEAP